MTIHSVEDILSPYHALEEDLNKIKRDMERVMKSATVASSNPLHSTNIKLDGHLTQIQILDLYYDVAATVNKVLLDFSLMLQPHVIETLRSIRVNMKNVLNDTADRIRRDGYDVKEWPALLNEVDTEHLVEIEKNLRGLEQHFIENRHNYNLRELRKLEAKVKMSLVKNFIRFLAISSQLRHEPDLMGEEGYELFKHANDKNMEIINAIIIKNVPDFEKLRLLNDAIAMIPGIQLAIKKLINNHLPKIDQAPAVITSESVA